METIQLICVQLQHAIHLDVNQNQFSCQNKKKLTEHAPYLINKAFIVLINYL